MKWALFDRGKVPSEGVIWIIEVLRLILAVLRVRTGAVFEFWAEVRPLVWSPWCLGSVKHDSWVVSHLHELSAMNQKKEERTSIRRHKLSITAINGTVNVLSNRFWGLSNTITTPKKWIFNFTRIQKTFICFTICSNICVRRIYMLKRTGKNRFSEGLGKWTTDYRR